MNMAAAATRRVDILLFPQVEVLDFAGPYEVFTTATRMAARLVPGCVPPFDVRTVAAAAGPVRARAGLQVLADAGFADVTPPAAVDPAQAFSHVQRGVRAAQVGDVFPVRRHRRAGPDQAGVGEQEGAGADGDHQFGARGCRGDPAQRGLVAARVVDHAARHDQHRGRLAGGRGAALITSAGISAGIDMSLHIVERLAGRALAERTARQMDFEWTENAR